MDFKQLTREAVLRIGEVCSVDGRKISILVDAHKNLSDLFLDGDLLRNISVNSFVEIRKGFLSIIGRIEGEKIKEDGANEDAPRDALNKNRRILTVALSGYIDETGTFIGGTRELPLIGNEAYIVTRHKMHLVHNLVRGDAPSIQIATIFGEDFDVPLPIDGLFNSHIAIFGNTGSGKTSTLASLYQEFIRTLRARNVEVFEENCRVIVFDFNGEYGGPACITPEKKVYRLSTRHDDGDRIPLSSEALVNLEILSILADATNLTQKPFLRRALRLFQHVHERENPQAYMRALIRNRIKETLQMSEKIRALLLVDYFGAFLPEAANENGEPIELDDDLEWHNQSQGFKLRAGNNVFLAQQPEAINGTVIYQQVENYTMPPSTVTRLIDFLYLQLVSDVLLNRAQNDHITPVINRLKGKQTDVDRLFDLSDAADFWERNVVVVDLNDVSIDMKKMMPLLLSRRLYDDQKDAGDECSLNIIIDEAHNILSTESFREAESWKDYRLETFEEIIKEGRKFGVFLTIASQRPHDISPTITSQAHNYFIHRLINEKDLAAIASTVSYIDRVTEESIPTLPTGTCVFSGVASQVPLKINIKQLADEAQPRSSTRRFTDMVPTL
jgi:uncharacterized protein